jgi:hypothetical protein
MTLCKVEEPLHFINAENTKTPESGVAFLPIYRVYLKKNSPL